MSFSIYQQLAPDTPLKHFNARVAGVGNQNVPVSGSCVLPVQHNRRKCLKEFAIVDDSAHGDFSLRESVCEELGLIATTGAVSVADYQPLLDEYHHVFEGFGKAKTVYSSKLKEHANPVIKPCRRVLHALMEPLKKELNSMVELGVIRSNTKPTQ